MELFDLPDYVVINDESQDQVIRQKLRVASDPFEFPLSEEDLHLLTILEAKYDAEENMAGLAAPQIGLNKQAIIFEVPNDANIKKWRPDLTDTMPKTIWLNPSYQPIGDEVNVDYEACFSVRDVAAEVPRYKTISYKAFLKDGTMVEGIANGFLARAIQHETDHVHGKLFIDYLPNDKLLSMEQYRALRKASMEKQDL